MNIYKQAAISIIKNYPANDYYVCTCGIGPTGIIHLGKTFDILCSTFVASELKIINKKTKVVCFVDDCITDLHKKKIDSSFYIQVLKDELQKLGTTVDFIHSSDNYKNHNYDEYLKIAYSNEEIIHDILMKHHTGEYIKKLSAIFNVYCHSCGELLYNVNSIGNYQYSYTCNCGCHGIDTIFSNKTFLRWKVETPIRWYLYNSCFEPAAFNHNDPNGSFIIAKEIYQSLFKQQPPQTLFYHYFCDEKGNKFSAKKNVGYTINDLLAIFYPEQIVEYFKSININRPIKFSLRKMFNEIYYGKRWGIFQKSLCLPPNISHEQVISIINVSPYYFYDSNVVCIILSIKNSIEIRSFIEKIKSYNRFFSHQRFVASNQLKAVLGYMIDNNTIIEPLSKIRKILEHIHNYSYKLFCREFYEFCFNTESGPPLQRIMDNCYRYVKEMIHHNLHNEYTYMIVYPKGINQLDEIKKYVIDLGLSISNFETFVFDEYAIERIFGKYSEQNKLVYENFIGKKGAFLILFGHDSIARLLCCKNKNEMIMQLTYTSGDHENSSSVLAWYFKAFVYESIKEKLINVIDTPPNKERFEKHIIPVIENVRKLSSALSIGDEEYLLIIAALLHDIAKLQLEDNNQCFTNHATAGAEWAKKFLKSCNVCEYYIQIISRCIEKHNMVPEDTDSLDEKIIAAADGMAHIDYPWIMICKLIQKCEGQSYEVIYDKLFNDRLSKSCSKITFGEFKKEYSEKIDLLKQLLK